MTIKQRRWNGNGFVVVGGRGAAQASAQSILRPYGHATRSDRGMEEETIQPREQLLDRDLPCIREEQKQGSSGKLLAFLLRQYASEETDYRFA